MPSSSFIIGVDGGGTKTVAWLAPFDDPTNGVVIGRGQAGPGNPRAVGFDVALGNIEAAIDAALTETGLPRGAVAAACFGLAGAGRRIEQDRISEWAIQRGIAPVVRVVGDAEPILAAASPDNCGIALICGTGSLAWGRNAAGETARCGGWGYLLGDEGSAYAIALAGLRAAMRSFDGRGPVTELCERFQAALDAASVADLIDRVYSSEMSRERLASLATIVFEVYASDTVGNTILKSAAHELAEMVQVLMQRLVLPENEYALAIAGSVILNQEAYRAEVLAELGRRRGAPGELCLVREPVKGAVALARRAAR